MSGSGAECKKGRRLRRQMVLSAWWVITDQPLVEVEVELPMVEFLPHMEESIDLANYLGHDQNFSNCNDLPSSMLLPSEAELLHIPTCSTFMDLSDLSDPTDAELYHFYI